MNRIKIRWHAILIIASLAGLLGCGGLGAKQQAQTPGQLTPAPISISFGNVQIGTTQTVAGSVSNTGGSSITVSAVTVTGTGYSITGMGQSFTLAPGQNANFSALFAPTSPGTAAGSVAFVSSSGTANVPLSGTGMAAGDLTTNPTSISFGNVLVGSKSSQTETLKNTGSANLTVTAAAISGAGLSYAGLSLPLTLAPNQASTFGISFTPTVAGASNGELSLTVSGSQATVDIALSGNGVTPGTLTPNPASIAFGNVQVGSSASLLETLTNTGGSSLTISAAAAGGAGFSLSGLALPVTLPVGQSTSFTVFFNPAASGAVSGNVSITSTGSNPNLSIPLTGTGVAQGTLTANPASLAFGSVQIGSSTSLSETLTNSGGSSLTISAASASGAGFSLSGLALPVTLTAGQSTSFKVLFSPTASGAVSGNVSITSTGSNPNLSIPLTGTGVTQGDLTANPSSLAFGSVQVGQSSSLSETLTNTGGSSLTISAASASGAGFSLSGLTLPVTLTAGQSTSFKVLFSPTASGAVSGNVSVTSTGSDSNLNIPLTGTGVTQGDLTANPSSLAFGNVQVGQSSSLSETLTNTGGSSLTISAASASGAGFSLSGLTLPVTLTAGQSTSFKVLFSPTASGAVSGNVSITSTGTDSNLNIPLTGTGVTQGTLTANPTSLAFGSVQVGKSSSLSETLTNSGGSSLTISAASASGAGFSLSGLTLPMTLNPGQGTSFTVMFSPAASGAVSGNLSITSTGSDSTLNIPLTGTGVTQGTLTANPTSLAFGSVQVGNSTNLSETLTNTGGSAVTISQANLTGAMFAISGLTLPQTLNPNQSVTFTATFTPTGAGGASGSLSVVSTASNSPLTIALTGTGTSAGTLAVSPTGLSFGNVVVGTSASLNGSLTASGASVTVQPTSPSNGEFVLSGIALPQTIPAGQSATFTVTFTPQSSGATSASLSFPSNASNSPTVQTMTGTGTAAPVHTVLLTWNASGTGGITSYNVYRAIYAANSCGSYSNIASTPGSTTTYTDSAVTDGTTYCYATTAVDPEGESAYSNIAEAAIPAP